MNMFDRFKKKGNDNADTGKHFSDGDVERTVTQDVAICMMQMKITSMPILKFFHEDRGLFGRLFQMHMSDPNVEIVKRMYGDDMYLNLLGCHALGAGIYITLCQKKYDKSVDAFSAAECDEIMTNLFKTDSYELGIKTLGISLDGAHKRSLDHIVITGLQSYNKAAGSQVMSKECLHSFMHVLFNAGITVVMRG